MRDEIPVTPEEEAAWAEMEQRQALAAQPVPAPVEQEPRWYAVDRHGIATLCCDEPDAIMEAAQGALAFPNNAPYRAVQLVELVEPSRGEPSATADAHPAGTPVLYQHDDGRYGLSFGPAQFAVGEPAWHHVPIDVVERPPSGQSAAPGGVYGMLHELVTQLAEDEASNGDAPGHHHEVPGIWDSDNGDLAGKPCAWCALWRKAKAMRAQPAAATMPADTHPLRVFAQEVALGAYRDEELRAAALAALQAVPAVPADEREAFDALQELVNALRERHYGRMSDEVQRAYDRAWTIVFTKPSAAPAVEAAPQAGEDAAGQVESLDVDNHRLRRAMQKVMARLAYLLDEDQFSDIESIVTEAGVAPPEHAGEALMLAGWTPPLATPTPPAATAAPSDDPIKPEEVPAAMVEDLRSAIEGECDGLDVTEHQARMILGLLLTEHPDWERHGGAQPAASAEPVVLTEPQRDGIDWAVQTLEHRQWSGDLYRAAHLRQLLSAPVAAQASAVVNQQLTTDQAPAANGDALDASMWRYCEQHGFPRGARQIHPTEGDLYWYWGDNCFTAERYPSARAAIVAAMQRTAGSDHA